MNTSLLAQELAPLNAQIEQTQKNYRVLEEQLNAVEAELEKFSDDRQRFDALRDVCDAFEKLSELNAGQLFWEGIPGGDDATGHLERARGRVANFDEQIGGVLETQTSLTEQIQVRILELEELNEEVCIAYEREERRQEEFVVEREISSVPNRVLIMPWTKDAESEKRFRRAIVVALLFCFIFGSLIPLVHVPIPDRSVEVVQIPERLVKLVKKEPPRPAQKPRRASTQVPENSQDKPKKTKTETASKEKEAKPVRKEVKAANAGGGGGGSKAARQNAERVGVLAFKNTFAGMMDETPVARIGTEARLSAKSQRVAGQAVAQRSLVTIQGVGGSSGGIGNAAVSRNVGNGNVNRIGGSGIGEGGGGGNGNGVGFGGQVESTIAGLAESSRPLSNDGIGPGRTDEEIQIVFDKYKATLYRIYNKELRKDPTLRGKILLRICIEANGSVSMCKVESTDLESPELVAKIVDRIKRFNFGAKPDVPKTNILYPIDFLPAG